MRLQCPSCSQQHFRADDLIAQGIRAGAIGYVDALCPWCRFAYNLGKALNSPFGAVLCGVAIGTLVLKIRESLK